MKINGNGSIISITDTANPVIYLLLLLLKLSLKKVNLQGNLLMGIDSLHIRYVNNDFDYRTSIYSVNLY